jgi:hypothetical protein
MRSPAEKERVNPEVLRYLNPLSDLPFGCARGEPVGQAGRPVGAGKNRA